MAGVFQPINPWERTYDLCVCAECNVNFLIEVGSGRDVCRQCVPELDEDFVWPTGGDPNNFLVNYPDLLEEPMLEAE